MHGVPRTKQKHIYIMKTRVTTSRGATGLFQATLYPSIALILHGSLEPGERGRVMGFWNTCTSVGGLVSASSSAVALSVRGHWRAAFEVAALLALGCAACGSWLIDSQPRPMKERSLSFDAALARAVCSSVSKLTCVHRLLRIPLRFG